MSVRFDIRCPNIEFGELLARFNIGASNIESNGHLDSILDGHLDSNLDAPISNLAK